MNALVWLKNIQHSDKTFLLDARNHDRKYFIDDSYISVRDHSNWFEDVLQSGKMRSDYEFFIIMAGFEPIVGSIQDGDVYAKVGTISLNYQTGEIGNVIVVANYKRLGIGRQAMKIAIGMMQSRGIKNPFVRVRYDNIGAKVFYEKTGFAPTQEIMKYGKS